MFILQHIQIVILQQSMDVSYKIVRRPSLLLFFTNNNKLILRLLLFYDGYNTRITFLMRHVEQRFDIVHMEHRYELVKHFQRNLSSNRWVLTAFSQELLKTDEKLIAFQLNNVYIKFKKYNTNVIFLVRILITKEDIFKSTEVISCIYTSS